MRKGVTEMKVLSIEFSDTWSWGLIFSQLKKHMDIEFSRQFFYDGKPINTSGVDIIMAQNVTLLKKFKERLKTVCRMGGNLNFDNMNKIEPLLKEMGECYCLIATNQNLFDIAKTCNDNVYLIPNGIDLEEWKKPKQKKTKREFTVGFCGNITNQQYREYKGFDFVETACRNLGVKLKTALYLDEQIPHDKMQKLFYGKIDCLVHPTLGEGSSNTLMEACACGVPIITTKVAGYHGELMKDGKDVLFCKRSWGSVQQQIKLIKNDPNLAKTLSRGARKFAEKHHDINVIAKQYEEIFKACDAEAKKPPADIQFLSVSIDGDKIVIAFTVDGGTAQVDSFPGTYTERQIKSAIKDKLKIKR